jgi:hypothetical protein
LKNVGNTCYLNSLLQTYFMMPQLRKRVLSLELKNAGPSPANDPSSNGAAAAPVKDDTTPFMKELQRMYSHLIASQEKFFDPSKLFKSLVDEQGNPVRIGSQEDVGEFNDLFLWRVGKGLASPGDPAAAEGQPASPDFASAMFDSEASEVLAAKDETGEMKEVEKPVSMGRHLVRCSSAMRRLELTDRSLDSACWKRYQRHPSSDGSFYVRLNGWVQIRVRPPSV